MLYREPLRLPCGAIEVGRSTFAMGSPLFEDKPTPLATISNLSARERTRAASQSIISPEGTSSMRAINADTLRTLGIAYSAAFQEGFDAIPTFYDKVAMMVMSSSGSNEYGWLGLFPQVREWLGDRVINSLKLQRYLIENRSFELTVSVPRTQIEDDNIGIFKPMFTEMGRGCKELPDKIIAELIAGAFQNTCYDGQYFFDPDHPVITAGGQVNSVSNFLKIDQPVPAGQPTPAPYDIWYLLDTSRSVRPFVFQQRRPFALVSKTKPEDDNVFWGNEFVWGADGRCNAGYGFWQLAYAVQGPLTAETYEFARNAMTTLRGDNDHRLGIVPNTLLAPMSLEKPARQLLKADRDQFGATNVWQGSADLVLTPWL